MAEVSRYLSLTATVVVSFTITTSSAAVLGVRAVSAGNVGARLLSARVTELRMSIEPSRCANVVTVRCRPLG